MNEFERVRLHPHLHGLVAVYGDFFHVIFRNAIYSLLQDFTFTDLEISTVTEQNKITFEATELASVIEKELAIKTYIIEFEKDNFNEDFELDNDLDDEIGCEQQESAVEFDEMGKYYLYRNNFARENQRTFDTIAEAYDFLCQDADGACIFFCDGYGETQEPPPPDWLKKVINSCGKVEVEIVFPDGAKDIGIYQKKR